jgi:hypothetical protein
MFQWIKNFATSCVREDERYISIYSNKNLYISRLKSTIIEYEGMMLEYEKELERFRNILQDTVPKSEFTFCLDSSVCDHTNCARTSLIKKIKSLERQKRDYIVIR